MRLLACLMLFSSAAFADADLVIENAMIVDGTGADAYPGHIVVEGGVITAVLAPDEKATAKQVINAKGRVVAPGFIDLHSHGNPLTHSFENFLAQGVTTVTLGMDGSSDSLTGDGLSAWRTKAAEKGLELNVIPMSGHGTVRHKAGIDDGTRALSNTQTAALQQALRDDLAAGSFGLSLGLEYVPGVYAEEAEMKALGAVIEAEDAIIMSHMRSEDNADVEDAIDELVAMAPSGRVHISHLKVVYGKGAARADELLAFMEGKRTSGTRLSADVYPYAASFTGVGIIFPEWALPPTDYKALRESREDELKAYLATRIKKRGGPDALLFGTAPYAGKTMAEAAREAGKSPVDFMADLGPTGGSAAHFVMDRALVDKLVTADEVALSTDGSPTMRHPRGYGTYARLIEYYVREKGLMSLETAIHKATGLPAEIMQIEDRGIIKPGMTADLIIFKPEQVHEETNFTTPHKLATGFDMVLVRGQSAFEHGKATGKRTGKVLTKTP
ncbi:N-acyl-D-amino-acid deacylase family protein [Kordiimonas sp.]|uniref:N-acyl-D-amino-acid deacylase family protein n=1 Tax=Kordiimonas sp. TaxID=1970157 RepID=UPI003A95B2DE